VIKKKVQHVRNIPKRKMDVEIEKFNNKDTKKPVKAVKPKPVIISARKK